MRNSNVVKLILAGLCLCSLAAAQNLVVNPGFESLLSGWVANGTLTVPAAGWGAYQSSPHTGSYYAASFCEDSANGAPCIAADSSGKGNWLYQNITTAPGATYQLTFWYFPGVGAGPADLQVLWGANGSTLTTGGAGSCTGSCQIDVSVTGSTTYVQYTVSGLVATSVSTRLEFLARNNLGVADGLDDISLTETAPPVTTSVPTLSTWAIGILAILLVGIGAWLLKPRFSGVPRT
jgi:hypothetical protein